MTKKRIQTLNEALLKLYQDHFKTVDGLEKGLQRFIPFKDPKVGLLARNYVECRITLRTIISDLKGKIDDETKAAKRAQ